ncbi:MAG: MBL fold metallo-hydrolase [Desulforhopalus sp.]|nr:MBL fold metallo-hydrolase [Desulforhopalus sp.]
MQKNPKVYSCKAYLILGDWNRVEDVNTLIDPGIDDFVVKEIEGLSTGFGKMAIEQIILTHNHFDHAAGVPAIKEHFKARVLAFTDGPGVDELLPDGRFVKAGDDFLEVIHTPGHSSDSICLYAPAIGALFSGDTQLRMHGMCDNYAGDYVEALKKLANRTVKSIYSGHDAPVTTGCDTIIRQTLANLRKSADFAEKEGGREHNL